VQRKLNGPLKYLEQGIITLWQCDLRTRSVNCLHRTVVILHPGDGRRQPRKQFTQTKTSLCYGGRRRTRHIFPRAYHSASTSKCLCQHLVNTCRTSAHVSCPVERPEPTCVGKGDCIQGSCNTARTALRRGARTGTLRDAAGAAGTALRQDVLSVNSALSHQAMNAPRRLR
jgi:hypothetical protein